MRNYQTLSSIRRQLAQRGLRPNTGLGQHFLIDGNLLHLMVEKAGVGEGDLILEVGAGTGSLTQLLARRAGHVIAVELDARLLDMAQRALVRYDNVTVWQGDVLANKHTLAPELVRLVEEHLKEYADRRLKVVSDLPYKVATPVIVNLWESGLPVELMLVTVQRELAERLVARPGTKAYGALTVKVAVWAEAEVLRILLPAVFWPRPAVESAFVRLRRRSKPLLSAAEYPGFAALVDGLFRHRRKTVKRALVVAAREPGLAQIARNTQAADRADVRRVDQLALRDFMSLAQRLQPRQSPRGGSKQRECP